MAGGSTAMRASEEVYQKMNEGFVTMPANPEQALDAIMRSCCGSAAPPQRVSLISGKAASHEVLAYHLETILHRCVVLVEFARQATIFQHQAIGILEIN
jgi:hypothetical protein